MGQALSPQQLTYLAGEYSQMAVTLEKYKERCQSDPSVDTSPIDAQIGALLDASQDLANRAIATTFDEVQQVYRNLATITENANKMAASLTQEVGHISRVAAIASAMVGLASSLCSGNPEAVVSSVVACAKAVHA